MEKQIEWITARQVNEYMNGQLEKLLLREGFEMDSKKECLLRLKEHHIQMICRMGVEEIKLKLMLAPTWIYCDSYRYSKSMRLKWSNCANLRSNVYTDIAYKQKTSATIFYKKEEFFDVWDTVILPQMQNEIIDMYEKMSFDAYAFICENENEQNWKIEYEDVVCRNLVIGYNNFWNKHYEKGKLYLERAISEIGKKSTTIDTKGAYVQDIENAKAILDVYGKRELGWEKKISNKLILIEQEIWKRYLL